MTTIYTSKKTGATYTVKALENGKFQLTSTDDPTDIITTTESVLKRWYKKSIVADFTETDNAKEEAKDMDRIIDKIQKLLSLAGNNPSEEEAKAALLKAQKLMAKYSISQDHLGDSKHKKHAYAFVDSRVKDRGIHCQLANVIAHSFSCKALRNKGYIFIFERSENAQAAASATKFAFKTMRRGADKNIRAEGLDPSGKGVATIYNSYCNGFIEGLKSAMDAQCVALDIIVPKDVVDEMNARFNLRTSKKSKIMVSANEKFFSNGFNDGRTAMDKRSLKA